MSTFDIFERSGNRQDVFWLECIEGLDVATRRMYEIAAQRPGVYFVLNLHDRLVEAMADSRSLASTGRKKPDNPSSAS
jgi:hypothetical protein